MEGMGCLTAIFLGLFAGVIQLIVGFFKLIFNIIIGICSLFTKNKPTYSKTSNTDTKEDDSLTLSEAIMGAAIISAFDSKPKKVQKGDYSERELDDYCLEDWQKDLVRNGEFDPWDFNEEEPEEDDFYHEDN